MNSDGSSSKGSLRAWLCSETPESRRHSKMISLYQGWLTFKSNSLAMTGLAILLVVIFTALLAPFVASHDPFAQDLGARLLSPGTDGHFFGTDELGRDIYSRVVYGSRITLYIVALVALIAPIGGLLIGTAAGSSGGWIDVVLMRITDVFLAFPKLVLALAFTAAMGAGIENAVLAITLTAWPPYARIARAESMTLRNADFVEAARLQGARATHVIIRHIWPLCISSIIIRVTLDMAGIILTAAGLGFLGLGAQPPSPEWGAMISTGRRFILDQWWVAAVPGLAIFTISLAFNLLGDGMRDVLDPKGQSK